MLFLSKLLFRLNRTLFICFAFPMWHLNIRSMSVGDSYQLTQISVSDGDQEERKDSEDQGFKKRARNLQEREDRHRSEALQTGQEAHTKQCYNDTLQLMIRLSTLSVLVGRDLCGYFGVSQMSTGSLSHNNYNTTTNEHKICESVLRGVQRGSEARTEGVSSVRSNEGAQPCIPGSHSLLTPISTPSISSRGSREAARPCLHSRLHGQHTHLRAQTALLPASQAAVPPPSDPSHTYAAASQQQEAGCVCPGWST